MSSEDIAEKLRDEIKIEEDVKLREAGSLIPQGGLPEVNSQGEVSKSQLQPAWKEYINLPVIKALAHHCSGTIVAMLFYALVAIIVRYSTHEGWVKDAVEIIEGIVLIGLFIVLSFQMFNHLFKGKSNGSPHSVFAA